MTKQKTVPELKAEIAANERQLAQLLENRRSYYEKGGRRKRAHRLITRGAAVESVVPLAKVLSETEFYTFAEKALALPEVKGLLMEAVNEHNKNEFGGD
jgi:chorismate mutase